MARNRIKAKVNMNHDQLFTHRYDYDIGIDKELVKILDKLKLGTVGQLRTQYYEKNNHLLSWITVKRHIDNLINLNKVEEASRGGNENKRIIIYRCIT